MAEVQRARREAASIVQKAFDSEIDPIVAARKLSVLHYQLNGLDDDPDFTTILEIVSETDALPLRSGAQIGRQKRFVRRKLRLFARENGRGILDSSRL